MTVGSVVDFKAFSQAAINIDRETPTAATDLKAQVDQYLAYNKKDNRYFSTRRRDDERTIFTVYYGLWDLLVYSMMTKDQATGAIDESIAGLFQELDLLAESAAAPIKVILPRMIETSRFYHAFKQGESMQIGRTPWISITWYSYWLTGTTSWCIPQSIGRMVRSSCQTRTRSSWSK